VFFLFRNAVRLPCLKILSFRCLEDYHLEPKERPFVCLASKVRLPEYNVGCCSNVNFCNENLTVELVPKTIDADESMLLGGTY